jgi:hypothetical protein
MVGLGMAVAGVDKLAGERSYARLYRRWGWTRQQMRLAGAAELAGGLMMAFRATRRLGGGVMAAASVTQLTAEIAHGDGALAAARSGVLGAALLSLIA